VFEALFQERMAEAELLPQPVRTLAGNLYFKAADECWWLEQFIQARHHAWWECAWNEHDCASAARLLAQFHRVGLEDLQNRKYRVSAVDTRSSTTGEDLGPLGTSIFVAFSRAIVEGTRALPRMKYTDAHVRGWRAAISDCQKLADRSRHYVEETEKLQDTEQLRFVHGDFHPGNILFRSGGSPLVIDLEHVHIEHWLYDLAYGLVMFATPWNAFPEGRNSYDDVKYNGFLSNYLSSVNLNETALRLLPNYSIVACILIATWLIEWCAEFDENSFAALNCLKHVIAAWKNAMRSAS
jgi:hypothetical protein